MSEQPSREAKHMSIFHAIKQIRDTKEHLNNLILEVGGSDEPPKDKKAEVIPDPTLASTLKHAANEIMLICEQINTKINELKELIL